MGQTAAVSSSSSGSSSSGSSNAFRVCFVFCVSVCGDNACVRTLQAAVAGAQLFSSRYFFIYLQTDQLNGDRTLPAEPLLL